MRKFDKPEKLQMQYICGFPTDTSNQYNLDYSVAGRYVLGKSSAEVLRPQAEGRTPEKGKGRVFPSTNRLTLVNNVFIHF